MTRPLAPVFLVLLVACNTKPSPEKPAAQAQPLTAESQSLPSNPASPKAMITASACKADGGTIVGDIGDGAIHKPDYTCESNGKSPVGRIKPEQGEPVAVEGSVCCGP